MIKINVTKDGVRENIQGLLTLLDLCSVSVLAVPWLMQFAFLLLKVILHARLLKKCYKNGNTEVRIEDVRAYNRKTLIVRDSFFFFICITELCFLVLVFVSKFYRTHPIEYKNITKLGNCPEDLYTVRHNISPAKRILVGLSDVFAIFVCSLIALLTNFLRNRMLNRTVKNNFYKFFLLFGFQSFIILVFCNKYTYFFNFSPHIFLLLNLLLLVSEGRKLSLVLIGRVRELRQSFGECKMYKNEFTKYRQFRIFYFNLCVSFFIGYTGYALRFLLKQVTFATNILKPNYQCFLGIYPNIHLKLIQKEAYVYIAVYQFSGLLELIGLVLLIIPSYLYMFEMLLEKCKRRNKAYRFGPGLIQPFLKH